MKKKLILLPITLTALTPAIGLVGCGNTDTPELETHIVTFSAGDHGSLEGETTVTVKGDKTTLGEITKPTVIADEAHGWFFDHWDYDDSYVINDDVTITALYQNLSEYMIDMDNIEAIIYLEGVEYAQGKFSGSQWTSEYDIEMTRDFECSTTVYHQLLEMDGYIFDEFNDEYIYPDQNEGYKKQICTSKDGEWEITDADADDFRTPGASIGAFVYGYYSRLESSGETLSFNIKKKCYEASWVEQQGPMSLKWNIEFYFLNDKLIAFNSDTLDEEHGSGQTTEATITYDQYTPDLPISPN
ncbi:MAG: hypothetical protein ACOQNV_00890 [Mycoplasmoidaceae bacterium]